MSTLKTTNLQNADASSANIVLGQGSGGGATISGVTTTTTLQTADSIIHTGDTDTKIRFPSADTITAETGGTERLRILSDGEVLIGRTTKQNSDSTVEIQDTTNTYVRITSGNTTGSTGVIFGTSDDHSTGGIYYNGSTDDLTLAGHDNNTRLTINSSGNATFAGIVTATSFVPTDIQTSYRNKVINGAMTVSQRATSFSGSATAAYTLDRFKVANGASWNFDTTITQETAGPDGFRKSLKITPDATDTPTGGENGVIDYFIEGQDCQDFAFGTSSAKKVTVSFYAKSSSQNNNQQYTFQCWHKNSSNTQYVINKAFTVTSSWQRFTFTWPANTSQNILFDNNWGFRLVWILASGPDDIASEVSTWTQGDLYKSVTGQSNFMDNTSNEFHLTGVQLEVGSSATPFEHRSYADELIRCERYYEEGMVSAQSYVNGNQHVGIDASYRTQKRADNSTLTWTQSGTQGNMTGTTPDGVHRNNVWGAYAYQYATAAGNYYYYYEITADCEL